ncbi:glutathione synthetase [Cryptococcus deuterogattii 99/473]|uniref:Glutathione synthetase n=1 Tax=Cryptococcus deuterogattii Ram5 TaxID=1296110 RepID=A0A0D0U4K7_9TREE|nr:glutathione synthetase [Cryptococcus deuterogattii Ram5]KIY56420.1 glutathione synthetase [Cryptococcus deuterogattii 99/473]
MSTTTALPQWPPALTEDHLRSLTLLSSLWSLSHGYTLLPQSPTNPPTSGIPAPLSLLPTPFPRQLYDLAVSLQPIYNALYVRIALDWEFLDRVMGGSVSKVDDFQGELWRGWKSVRDQLVQEKQLGLFRSDYLLHEQEGGLGIKQVEFNTIAASFGALSQRAGELHKYLAKATRNYYDVSPHLSNPANYPTNEPLKKLAAGLAAAWKAFGDEQAVVLFVVQDGERNVFDQKWLEFELLEAHDIHSVRRTFSELSTLSLPSSSDLILPPSSQSFPSLRVAVIYYRSAYTPTDYPTEKEWATRIVLEKSTAIKCPSMALQLAGAKKIQQVLTEDGVLEDFLLGPERPDVGFGKGAGSLTKKYVDDLRSTWIGLYPMDNSSLGQQANQLALQEPERFVLKPQREGGGNNIYRESIPPFLKSLAATPVAEGEPDKKEGYILMELIQPPQKLENWLVRGGEGKPRKGEVVSELGVYGVALFGGEETLNERAGTLLRTKGRESDEGGVAIGISSIDSPLLVD